MAANKISFLEKVKSLITDFNSTQKNLNVDRNKKLFPLSMSDNNLTAAELQRAEAMSLLKSGDLSETFKQLKMSYDLGRVDFVSTILESLNIPDINSQEYFTNEKFYEGISDLKNQFFSERDINSADEKLADIKDALFKSNAFTTLVNKGENYLWIPSLDSKEFIDQMQVARIEDSSPAAAVESSD